MKKKSRKKTEKKAGRIFLKYIFIGMFVFFGWYVWDYTGPKNFPIVRVKIFTENNHVEKKDLQEVIYPYLKSGFFHLNFVGLKKKLLTLPWVYKISLRRHWPNTLIVNVVEQKAILQWGGTALINQRGDVFAPDDSTFPKGLPIIFGPREKEKEIYSLYKTIVALFEPLDLAIKRMVLTSHNYWEIVLSNGTSLYLKKEKLLAQIELLVNVYRRITADHKKDPKSIDLRYKSGLAVRWD